ncbi:MAG: TolC family protein [Pirellulales bacterium]|nr:TolC family protein [Pirellulales bacterium]
MSTSYQDPIASGAPKSLLELTLEEVFECTLQNHPVLRVQKEEVEAARAHLVTAGLRINPEFVLDTDSELAGDHAVNMNSRLMFTFERGKKRHFRQAAATAEITRAKWELNSETERILIEAADAAWEVLYLQELLELETSLHEMAAKTAELQGSRADVSYADKIVAETDAAELELERLESRSRLEIARIRLSEAIGFDCPMPLRMQGQLQFRPVNEIPIDDLFRRVQRCRPELCSTQAAVAESRYLHSLACANAKSNIRLGPRYREGFDGDADQAGMRFAADIPLFNRNQGGIQESAAEIRKQKELFRATRIATLADAASVYRELLELQNRLQYFRAVIIPLAERTETTIHDAFAAGQIRADQMSDLQRDFIRLRLKELTLRHRFNQLLTRLEFFLGEPI